MDDPFGVCAGHRIGQGNGQLEELRQAQVAGRNDVGKRSAFHQLHGNEVRAFALLYRMDCDDVGMFEGGNCLGLAFKSLPALRVIGHLQWEDLEGHVPFQFGVLSTVDIAHASGAKLFENLVVGEGLTDHCVLTVSC